MPPGYTAQQKGAITQFMNFTQADRNTAIRVRLLRLIVGAARGQWLRIMEMPA